MREIQLMEVKKFLPVRKRDSHKGDYGNLLNLCGSTNTVGAAILSAKAALRCGIGLLNIALPQSIYAIVASQVYEPIFTILQENTAGTIHKNCIDDLMRQMNKSSAILMGCGLGYNDDTKSIVYEIINKYERPIVIDADGINAISDNINILKTAKSKIILTPHPGEMARLLHTDVRYIQQNRADIAKEFSQKYNVVLVLKGTQTLISSGDGELFINKIGNAGMATAGSGDVLAGMISAFVAQGIAPLESAKCGVYLHSLAGDRCANKLSSISMISSDIINELPSLFKSLE